MSVCSMKCLNQLTRDTFGIYLVYLWWILCCAVGLNFSVDEIECCVERISFVLYLINRPLWYIKTELEGSEECESEENNEPSDEENNEPSDEVNNEPSDEDAPKSCCQCTLC